jgi:hypothetical protein
VLYLVLNCLTCFLTFGNQIFVVYHRISSSVCILVFSGIFWSFQIRVVIFMYSDFSNNVDPDKIMTIFLMVWLYFKFLVTDGFVFSVFDSHC